MFVEKQYPGVIVMRFMTDDDPVLRQRELQVRVGISGRVLEQSGPDNPEPNGPSEVSGRMITWMGRTLCADSGLPS